MSVDPWHFPRRELAEQLLALLSEGPAQALTLFAPRRTGKTEFLLKDLGPLAEARRHRVIYMSFWQAPLAPLAVILNAIEHAQARGSLADRVRHATTQLAPRLKLSLPLPGTGAELDLTALHGKPPTNLLLHLDDLLGRLAQAKRVTLIFFDEVQELARDAHNRTLIAALRTSLDKRRGALAAIFTGSSREGLQAMFSEREAPFFHFATSIDLPPLGAEFVDHVSSTFQTVTKRKIDRSSALKVFATLHGNPAYFRGWMELMVLYPALSAQTALDRFREHLASDLQYPQKWLLLNPLQRATLKVLAHGENKPFGTSARAEIGRRQRANPPSIAQVQTALRKLASLGIVDRWTGKWIIEDPELAAWIRTRPD
jgi:uncharacterized protein